MNAIYSPEGVIPVLPVPFHDGQLVDLDAFATEVRWAAERPLDGVALFGLGSEYWKLGDDERVALADVLVQSLEGRKPALLSVTDSTRFHAVRFAQRFARAGADALIIMPPHFMSPGAEKVIEHCRAVADVVAPLPVIVQYSPAYIGVQIAAEAFARMHDRSPNLAYIKVEPRPPGPMIEAIGTASGGKLQCLIGQGGLTLADCRLRGIVGVMPGLAVVEVYRKLWTGLAENPVSEATWQLHDRMVAIMSHAVPTIDMWVASEKQMLAWRGVIDRPMLRDPSSPPEAGFFRYLRQCFDRLSTDLEDNNE
ncbi:MAG: dihydrodipicolinate synthase family protein [Patescibacteria group bacterium]|nr:dihydrodipicolinate synthase family protein [Patescibacteria group bacterium]